MEFLNIQKSKIFKIWDYFYWIFNFTVIIQAMMKMNEFGHFNGNQISMD